MSCRWLNREGAAAARSIAKLTRDEVPDGHRPALRKASDLTPHCYARIDGGYWRLLMATKWPPNS